MKGGDANHCATNTHHGRVSLQQLELEGIAERGLLEMDWWGKECVRKRENTERACERERESERNRQRERVG